MKKNIFISYAWRDNKSDDPSFDHGDVDTISNAIINEIKSKLSSKTISIDHFIDRERIQNDIFDERIKYEINKSDIFLIFLSNSYIDSASAKTELGLIFERENQLIENEKIQYSENCIIYPKIYIIYLHEVSELTNRETIIEVVRNLQRRAYFNFINLRLSKPLDTERRVLLSKIAKFIVSDISKFANSSGVEDQKPEESKKTAGGI